MANADNSLVTGKFRGSLGKQLVFRDWEGKTVVAKSPKKRTGASSLAQEGVKEKFFVASRYGKAVTTSPDTSLADAYAASLRPRQNVYSRAMEDFLSPPDVQNIDTRNYSGAVSDKIVVRALDDFRVTGVRVEIYAADSSLLESGNAVQQINGIDWAYTATQANNLLAGSTVKAIAFDVPGNEGMLEVIL